MVEDVTKRIPKGPYSAKYSEIEGTMSGPFPFVVSGDGTEIAMACDATTPLAEDVCLMQLFAAAPELYAACKAYQDLFQYGQATCLDEVGSFDADAVIEIERGYPMLFPNPEDCGDGIGDKEWRLYEHAKGLLDDALAKANGQAERCA